MYSVVYFNKNILSNIGTTGLAEYPHDVMSCVAMMEVMDVLQHWLMRQTGMYASNKTTTLGVEGNTSIVSVKKITAYFVHPSITSFY